MKLSVFTLCALLTISSAQAGTPHRSPSSLTTVPRGTTSIARITRPAGWNLEPEIQRRCGCAAPQGWYTIFTANASSKVHITVHYPPYGATIDDQFLFEEVITKPPHVLDAVERRHMAEVTGSKSNGVELGAMSTVDVNGKRALIIDKTVNDQIASRVITYYVSARGVGERLERISLEAPPDEFSSYLDVFKKTLASIVWKK